MSVEENKAVVCHLLDCLSNNCIDEMIGLFHEDMKWEVMGNPELFPAAGINNKEKQAEILRGMSMLTAGGLRMKITGMTAENDRVAVEAESEAQLANGKEYHNNYHFLFVVEDGKIIKAKEYCDTLQAAHSFS